LNREALTRHLSSLQKRRAALFYPALVLAVISVFRRNMLLSAASVFFWFGAGMLCMMEARALSKLGLKPANTLINAVIYFAIGLLLVFRH
jgi:hypothetical protein